MNLIFDDKQFSFQLLRALGSAPGGGADVGECLATAYRIKEGDFESWYSEWLETAERVKAIADDCLEKGHLVSARDAYLRAFNYYRLAEFYLHQDPEDPRIMELYNKGKNCFEKALELGESAPEKVLIPYEDTELPGYFYPGGEKGTERPTLILQTGFDGTLEELHFLAVAVAARGMNCLTFEGPGQGSVIREQGLPFRPDWEKVVSPVVDFALNIEEVDPDKVALMGLSFGGYLAPRAAAFEKRLAACIANGGVYDFMGSHMPEGMSREQFVDSVKQYPDQMNKGMEEAMKTNTDTRWGVNNGMFTFKASSPADWMLKASEYYLGGVAEKIECPTLVVDSEDDFSFPGQAKKLYDVLECHKTWMVFTAREGAGDHCQVADSLLSSQRILDWLQETLSS